MVVSSPGTYIGLVYLHVIGSLLVTALGTQVEVIPKEDLRKWWVQLLLFVATLVILFVILPMNTGPLRYILYGLFLVLLAQASVPLTDRLMDKGTLQKTITLTVGAMLAMTAVAFYDKQNLLGLGPYLFAGLIGLILARLGLGIAGVAGAPLDDLKSVSKGLSWIGAALFTAYIAYDTQVLKRDSRLGVKQRPDILTANLSLYLDVLNLFSNLADIVE